MNVGPIFNSSSLQAAKNTAADLRFRVSGQQGAELTACFVNEAGLSIDTPQHQMRVGIDFPRAFDLIELVLIQNVEVCVRLPNGRRLYLTSILCYRSDLPVIYPPAGQTSGRSPVSGGNHSLLDDFS